MTRHHPSSPIENEPHPFVGGRVGTRRDRHVHRVDLPRLVVAREVVQLSVGADVVPNAFGHVFFHGLARGFVVGCLCVGDRGERVGGTE